MKREVIMLLVAMTILTAIYIGAIVGTSVGADNNAKGNVLYGAYRYRSETPPPVWYNLTYLGIVDVFKYSNGNLLHINVDLEHVPKELSPLQAKQPVFKYKNEFYQVSLLWNGWPAYAGPIDWQVPVGGLVGIGWLATGTVIVLRSRKTKRY
jgi:hypothetical protein